MENLRLEAGGQSLIIRYGGELTKETSADLKRAVEQGLNEHDIELVAFDMSQVTLLDSSGIGFLVSLNTTVQGLGRRLVLFSLAERLRKTLDLVRLGDFFTIASSEAGLASV